ncbi:hypothetical protein [Micromonospora sp. 4G55]|uniref:hypothetical protein n=1 Tax=Micromonospora sp. 4G55 TaxID=2806102 RepID=UPI001A5EDD6B|nr:hypothetical protein [Micromonospora sp. 4G55]MBM0257905.1 hypothetical protein [Micromonospora sp. 4G55]
MADPHRRSGPGLRARSPARRATAASGRTHRPVDAARAHVWSALRDAVAEHDIDVDAANRVLHAVDLPLLPRRWQVRLTLPILIEVTATSRENAFDTAEAAVETTLTGADLDVHIEWDGRERDDANPGDLDPTTAEHPYPGQ